MRRPLLLVAALVGVLTVPGCEDGGLPVSDLSAPPDQTPAPADLSRPDLSGPAVDLARPDAAVDAAIDLAAPADLAPPADGGSDAPIVLPDLLPGPDLVTIDAGPAPTTVPHQRWVDFCKAFTACGFWPGSLSTCIEFEPLIGNVPFAPQSVLTCIHDAGPDCAAIKTCWNNGSTNWSCDYGAGFKDSCTNNTSGQNVVSSKCFAGLNFRETIDCSKLGLQCVSANQGEGTGCGFGTCDPAANTQYCIANFYTDCAAGRLKPIEDCRVFSTTTCAVNKGLARCVGNGAACTTDRCNGTTLVACKEGFEATFDCTKLGSGITCVSRTANGKPYWRCGRGESCDGNTHADTCNGNMLTFCDSGVVTTVDCVAEGWKKCGPLANGSPGCSP